MTNFLPGDKVEFQLGLPGQEQLIEDSLIDEVGTPDNANGVFIRGYNDTALELPDGTLMRNDSRAIYSVNTAAPHDLIPGDLVYFENSSFPEINAVHSVARAGKIIPGSLVVTIDEAKGTVVDLQISNRGYYYTRDFLISFTGGGGQGAFGYAYVTPIELGGRIDRVEILEPGLNYRTTPTPILGDELTQTQFEIYTKSYYTDDNSNVKYSATASVEHSSPIEMTSSGGGYNDSSSLD